MKMAKRILSLVLVLAMVACLGVTAFADTPATPYINVTVKNSRSGATDSWTVAATTGASVKSALDTDTVHARDWKPVADYYNPSIIHYALNGYGAYASTKFDKNYAQDVKNLKDAGYTDAAIKKITWYTGAYQGYGLVSYDETTGEYTYIYAGYDWTYSSNLSPQIWDYMCCYNVQATEVVQLVYEFTVSRWTTTTPLVSA